MFLVTGKKDTLISVLDTDDMKVDSFSKHELRDISSRYKLNIVGNITNTGFIDIKYLEGRKRGKESLLIASESVDNYETLSLSVQGIFMSGEINLKVASLYNNISRDGFCINRISDLENLCKCSKLDGIKCLIIHYVYAWKVLGYNKNILNDILADLYINKVLHEIYKIWDNDFLMSIKDSIAIFEDTNFAYFTNNKDIIICMKKSILNRYTKQDIKITKAIVLRKNVKYDEKTNRLIIQSCDRFLVKNDGLTYLYTPSCKLKELVIDEGAKLVLSSGKYDSKSCTVVCKDKDIFLKLKSKMRIAKFGIPIEFLDCIKVSSLRDLDNLYFMDTNNKDLCLALNDKLSSFIKDFDKIDSSYYNRLKYFEDYLRLNGVDNNLCSRFDFEFDSLKIALRYLKLFNIKVFYDLKPFLDENTYNDLVRDFGQKLLKGMEYDTTYSYNNSGYFKEFKLVNLLNKLSKSYIDECIEQYIRLYTILSKYDLSLESIGKFETKYRIKFNNYKFKHLVYTESIVNSYLFDKEQLDSFNETLNNLISLDSLITKEVEFKWNTHFKFGVNLKPISDCLSRYDLKDLIESNNFKYLRC